MKKIYVIMQQWIVPDPEVWFQGFGHASFVFTSKANAEKQMDEIHRMIESGEWYVNKGHRVEYDEFRAGMRTIKVNHSDGTCSMFRLQEIMMDAGYGI